MCNCYEFGATVVVAAPLQLWVISYLQGILGGTAIGVMGILG